MTSFDSGNGRDPIDPDFAGLFRPDDAASPEAPAWSFEEEPHFEQVLDPVVDPREEEPDDQPDDPAMPSAADADAGLAEPARTPPAVDTGRLFRSQGVAGHQEAVLALSSDRFGRLRTLERVKDEPPMLADAGPVVIAATASAAAVSLNAGGAPADAATMTRRERRRRDAEQGSGRRGARNITAGAVYLIVIGVTVLIGFANALLADGDVGWPTGIALVAASVYAALTVRREDDVVAIIVPPIAFLVAAMTAGQLFLGSTEGSVLNRAVIVFFTLADNWYWIIGATAAALVIVLVRRRQAQ